MLQWTWECGPLFEILTPVPLNQYWEVGSLDYLVVLRKPNKFINKYTSWEHGETHWGKWVTLLVFNFLRSSPSCFTTMTVPTYIFTNTVKHFPFSYVPFVIFVTLKNVYLLTLWRSFLEKCVVSPFVHFSIGLFIFIFLLLSRMSSLCFRDELLVNHGLQIFYPVFKSSFHLLMVFFTM